MEKAFSTAIVVSAILALLLVGVQVSYVVNANPIPALLPSITISSNGSIQSSLNPLPITKNGNVYTLTGNISGYSLDIQCSNIILEGEGNTLQAAAEFNANSGITVEASGVTVKNLSINQYYVGIDVQGSSNMITGTIITAYDNGVNVEGQSNMITENQISECGGSGVELSGSYNIVKANTIDCNDGCCISVNSDSNTINGNLLISGTFDIEMYGNSNTVTGNTITGDSHGIIFLDPASLNTIDKNEIVNNYDGISLDKQLNTFYLNNLINNTYNVQLHLFSDSFAPYSVNIFDNGSVGNYWSDYTAKYPDASEIGSTGIYNTPYVIDGNITDNHPMTTPYNIGNTGAHAITPPAISLLSPLNQKYNESSVPLLFTVDESVNWTGYSLDGQQNITITGNTTITGLSSSLHSITVYANDTFGNVGASQTVNFTIALPPEMKSFPAVTVAAVLGVTAVVVIAGLLVYFKKRKAIDSKH
jgi:parallel beta-helix repeat protein